MKKRPGCLVFLLVAVGLVVVVIVAACQGNALALEQSAPTQPPAALMVEVSPSPVPSPTLDIQATQMVQQTELTNAQAALAAVNLQIEQTNLEIQQSKEREAAALASIAENEAEKSANDLKAIEAQNEQTRLRVKLAELENEKIALANQAKELEIKQKQAETDARNGVFVPVTGGMVAGGFALGAYFLKKAPRKPEPAAPSESPQPAARAWAKTDNGGGQTWQSITPPLDPERFRPFAEYALGGGLLGINSVRDNAHVLSGAEYAAIIPWMQAHDYYGRDQATGGLVLGEQGIKDFTIWLQHNPPPLLNNLPDYAPPSPHDYGSHDHESTENAEGEGEGDPK